MNSTDYNLADCSIVRLNKENLKDLAMLHSEVYNSNIANDYFIQKYNTAFTGVECIGFIAYNKKQKPVSYYGVIPCFIQFEGKGVLSAQSADTMTHPHYRNQGMFTRLSNMTFALCKEAGIKLIFGFPNQNSYPTMIKKLGWIETEKLDRFNLPVNNFFRQFFFKSESGKILQQLSLPKKGLDNSVIENGFAGVYRDDAYFGYKNFSKTYVLRISCAELWVKINQSLVIGDVKLLKDGRKQFFKDIKYVARRLGVNKISFQVSPGCPTHNLFSNHYKAIPSFPVLFKDFGSGIPLEKIKFTFSDIDIF